jgi:hypothetical protein
MAQNTGSPNFLPWPDYTDDADGPDAFENLARAVDLALKGLTSKLNSFSEAVGTKTLTATDGLTLGSHTVRKEALFDIRNLSTNGHTRTFRHYSRTSDGAGIVQVWDGSTRVNELHMVPTGDIARVVSNGARALYLPFAMHTWSVQLPAIAAGTGKFVSLRHGFPSGRFNDPPAILMTPWNVDCLVATAAYTNTYVDIRATAHMDKGVGATWVHGLAVQMLAANAFS